MIVLMPAGVLAWLLGGYRWKWVRRFAWPALAGGVLLLSVAWWRALLAALTLVGVNTLPYGDHTPPWARPLVFASYALPVAWLSLTALPLSLLVCGIMLSLWMLLSRKLNWVSHKTWEGLAGLLQAIVLILGVQAHGY